VAILEGTQIHEYPQSFPIYVKSGATESALLPPKLYLETSREEWRTK
jgi:hypothetical protein